MIFICLSYIWLSVQPFKTTFCREILNELNSLQVHFSRTYFLNWCSICCLINTISSKINSLTFKFESWPNRFWHMSHSYISFPFSFLSWYGRALWPFPFLPVSDRIFRLSFDSGSHFTWFTGAIGTWLTPLN